MTLDGLYKARVVTNADPLGQHRLILQVPEVLGLSKTGWCEPVLPTSLSPQAGSIVWVAFQSGDSRYPVWLGGEPFVTRGQQAIAYATTGVAIQAVETVIQTVTWMANPGRRYRAKSYTVWSANVADAVWAVRIRLDGTGLTGATQQTGYLRSMALTGSLSVQVEADLGNAVTAGDHTIYVTAQRVAGATGNTANIYADASNKPFVLVDDVGL